MYNLNVNGQTIDTLTLSEVIARYGSVKAIESAGFRLVLVTKPVTKQVTAPSPSPIPTKPTYAKVLPLVRPVTKPVTPGVIRPDYSSETVRNAALALPSRFDVSWLPRPVTESKPCPVIQLYASNVPSDTVKIDQSIECQECLVYLSKCYCGKAV